MTRLGLKNKLNQWQVICLLFLSLLYFSLVSRRQWHPISVLLPGKLMDGGAWYAAVHGVTQSWTRLKRLSSSSSSSLQSTWPKIKWLFSSFLKRQVYTNTRISYSPNSGLPEKSLWPGSYYVPTPKLSSCEHLFRVKLCQWQSGKLTVAEGMHLNGD